MLTKEVNKYLNKSGLIFKAKDINKHVDEYCEVFQKTPVKVEVDLDLMKAFFYIVLLSNKSKY